MSGTSRLHRSTPRETLQESLDAWFSCGMSPIRAGERLNRAASTITKHVRNARQMGLQPRSEKPRIRVPAISRYYEAPPEAPASIFCEAELVPPTTETIRVIAIGDEHDGPGLEKDRFRWIGKFIADRAPDRIVRIGDIADFDSLSFHAPNDTLSGRYKPFFAADLDSLSRAQDELHEPIAQANLEIPEDLTLGNHCNRVWRFEDKTPELAGILQRDFTDVLKRYGIRWHQYGKMVMIGGVGFTHVPLNIMGKGISGKTATQTIGREAIHDVVKGHSHKADVHTAAKVGDDNLVRVFDIGCALPWGLIQRYAQHNETGWWWGTTELTIRGGRIVGWDYVPMFELQRRYG